MKVNSGQIPLELFSESDSDGKNLYILNKLEYGLLINLIKKQKKVVKIYFDKNKLDQYNTINSSLKLLFEYKEIFLIWFSENENLE